MLVSNVPVKNAFEMRNGVQVVHGYHCIVNGKHHIDVIGIDSAQEARDLIRLFIVPSDFDNEIITKIEVMNPNTVIWKEPKE